MTFEAALITAISVVFGLLVTSNVRWWRAWQAREARHDEAMRELASLKDSIISEITAKKDEIISNLAHQKDEAMAAVGAEKDRFIAYLETLKKTTEED